MSQLYCSLYDIFDDLGIPGVKSESRLLAFVEAASRVIEERLGNWIPITAVKRFDGNGSTQMVVPPLLAVTSIVDDGITYPSTDYLLYPRSRWWMNGPYTRIVRDPDATTFGSFTPEHDVLVITGRWGEYEETKATGATVANTTEITAAGTSLVVSNAADIAPGMTLLIESEQVLVEATGAATDSAANTNEAVDISEESIDTTDGTKFNVGEIIRIDTEKMGRIADIATNTIVVPRGWAGSQIATHSTATDIYVYRTFTVKRGVNGTTAATHANGTAISRYVVPSDINYLCRQIAGLMHEKAKGGWAGKIGDAALGEVFYRNEFPSDPIKEIGRQYEKTMNLLGLVDA